MADLPVPVDAAPMRLDQFVAASVPGLSRRRLRAADLRLNGRLSKHGALVRPGDVVSVPDSILPGGDLAANPDLRLPILHQDEQLVVLDKPPRISCVALRPDETGTVANFLLAAFPETRAAGEPLEAGLVHRLDNETSGVLVAARTPEAYRHLRQQFSTHAVEKTYMALVHGDLAEAGQVDMPIAHDPRHPRRMLACPAPARAQTLAARPASTRYQPVVRYGRTTLLRVAMSTGVRHQVRVHLASLGHPIVGDALYGLAKPGGELRHALHASRIRLLHPAGGDLDVESPIPADLEALLKEATTKNKGNHR